MARAGVFLGGCGLLLLASCASEMASTVDSPGLPQAPPLPIVEPQGILPVPSIPAALRGCWDAIPTADPEEPGGSDRLVITAVTIEQIAPGIGRAVASAEYVTKVNETAIEGLFSYPDDHGRATLATGLWLTDGADGGAPGTLRRQEGDAGSTIYRRCPAR